MHMINYPLAQPMFKRRNTDGRALPQLVDGITPPGMPNSTGIAQKTAERKAAKVRTGNPDETPGKDVASYKAGQSLRQKITQASTPDQVTALLDKAKRVGDMQRKTWQRILSAAADRLNFFEEKRKRELSAPAKVFTAKQEAEAELADRQQKNEAIIEQNEKEAKAPTKRKVAKAKKATKAK